MKFKTECEISSIGLKHIDVNDEYFYRLLACRILEDLPIDILHKLIKLNKIDPFSEDNIKKLNDYKTPTAEQNYILNLQLRNLIVYNAEIDL